MMKLGTYVAHSTNDTHYIAVRFKPGVRIPKLNEIVTDDIIIEAKDPVIDKVASFLYGNILGHVDGTSCTKMAEQIVELVKENDR